MEGQHQFNQAPTQQVHGTPHHVLHPEQEELSAHQEAGPVFGKLEVAPGVDGPRKVMRPNDRTKKALGTLGRNVAASLAVMAGVGGALGTTSAHAGGGIPGFEQTGKIVGTAVINNFLAGTPFGVAMDNQGNVGVVAKSPAQMAIMRPAARQQGIENLAASMGLSVIEQGILFSISRNANPGENPVTIKKYYNENHYTTSINLKQAPNGGLLLSTTFVENGLARSQMAIINIDQTGKMVTTVVGN